MTSVISSAPTISGSLVEMTPLSASSRLVQSLSETLALNTAASSPAVKLTYEIMPSLLPTVNSTTPTISTGNERSSSTSSQSSAQVAHNDTSIARIAGIGGGVIGGVILAGAIFLYVLRTKRSRTYPSQRRDSSHDISECAAVVSPTPSPFLDSDMLKNTGENNAEHLFTWRSTRIDSECPASIVSPHSAVPLRTPTAHLLTEEELITEDLMLLPNPPSSTNRFASIMPSADRHAVDAAHGKTTSLSAPPPPQVNIDTSRAVDSGYRFYHMVPPTPHSD